MLIIAYIRMK